MPELLIARWPSHGDVRVLVDRPYVYLRADDVEALAGVKPWGSGAVLVPAADELVQHRDAWWYPLHVAIARAELEQTEQAAGFIAWLDDAATHWTDDATLDAAHRAASYGDAVTVRRAADLLSHDPAIAIGQNALFDHLEQVGWINRNSPADDWVITPEAFRANLLTTRPRHVQDGTRRGRRYLQVYVTRDGLTQLRKSLRGLGAGTVIPIDRAPQPSLFD